MEIDFALGQKHLQKKIYDFAMFLVGKKSWKQPGPLQEIMMFT